MSLAGEDVTEIFRFEYHPLEGPPHRFRVIVDPKTGALRRVTECLVDDQWTLLKSEQIEYFEFSDEAAEEVDST